ncbi:unnamed protein product [Chondrus crispus]|uniref:Lipid IV(A) 3-deoxy-D-manno-octulosonic acid transferase n=1 Tax=Chondrus crispus TaxID=2769 RepID=R7QB21_CHOCR|nr:unnamed protein product [Chondrus crispus]CDF34611.1 unnamed protein product [Chondrus crispus]|eukprot:XP_005714430.1 unnamed protein product [Chondrus crispus]
MAVTEGRADEVVALKAHAGIRGREGLRNALLIVAPSQPTRGARIRRAATKADFGREEVLCAAEGAENPTESAAVYVADGPVGAESFYEYAPVVLVGDSFARGGKGSSFTPAAHYACCVIHGPWYDDFRHLVTAAVNEIMRQGFLRPREMRGAEDEMWKEPCMEALDEEDVVELVAAALTNKDRTTLLGSALQKAAVHLEKAAGDDAIHLVDDLMRLAAISAG